LLVDTKENMQLESLANETLLDLFEHLDIAYLIHAFCGLNSRFDRLLYVHMRNHQLNFQHLWKNDFDVICQEYLPFIIDQVISLRLSNEETPGLTELFLSHGFTIDRFIHLQTLSLYHIHSSYTLLKIVIQCRCLVHLTHLNIIKCDLLWEQQHTIIDLINNIWSIPNLTHCNLNTCWWLGLVLHQITTISLSIEHLSIEDFPFWIDVLSTLSRCTPRLKRLCIKVSFKGAVYHGVRFTIPSITSLQLSSGDSLDWMKYLFESVPNLSHLTIMTSKIYLDGNTWEKIILQYLPKIKIFRLIMNFTFPDDGYKQEEIKELLATFQTIFWIEKPGWFVRCHWDPTDLSNHITPYTSIYAFDTFGYSNKCCTKSMCLDQVESWSCGRIQIVRNWGAQNIPFDICNISCTCYPTISRLVVYQPIDENILLNFPSLNHLRSLHVLLDKNYCYSQLQVLLDRAPRLYSLGFYNYVKSFSYLFQLQSKSIRRLDFIGNLHGCREFFNLKSSSSFVTSPLASRCEVLLIRIENRAIVLNLIENMLNLRTLTIHCKDDVGYNEELLSKNDKFVSWLQNNLSSTCSVIRHFDEKSVIQIWIGTSIDDTSSSNDTRLIIKHRSKTTRFLSTVNCFFPTNCHRSN
jgi:hypothetical protein